MFSAEELKSRISKHVADGAFREVPSDLVDELRAAWKSSGRTQVQFADAVGLNVSQLSSKFYARKSKKKKHPVLSASALKPVVVAEESKAQRGAVVIHLAGGHRVELSDLEQLVEVMRALC